MKRLLLLIIMLYAPHANAGTCGGLNPVLASVSLLSFGNYSATTDKTASATVTVSCTVTLGSDLPSFTLSLSKGGGTFANRKMVFLTGELFYNLYTDGSYNTVWGDGTSGTQTMGYSASNGAASTQFTVYGKIPRDQFVLPGGPYLDSITVTASF